MNLKGITERFKHELSELYPEREISSIMQIITHHFLGWSTAGYLLNRDKELVDQQSAQFLQVLEELKTGKPIQYITGIAYFGGLELLVGPGVLIPRPETEELCLLAEKEMLRLPSGTSVLDIGTGSGCIALWMKNRFPFFQVTAMDKSDPALRTAKQNASKYNLEIEFVNADLLDRGELFTGRNFDIILSNPPYIPASEEFRMHTNVVNHEPHEALFAPDEDPLIFYRAIALVGKRILSPVGIILTEIHENYGEAVQELFRTSGYSVSGYRDIHDKQRFVKAVRLLQQG